MAFKHKAIAGAIFRAFSSQKSSLSDSISSWKGSLMGAKIHTTAAKEAGNFRPPNTMAFVKGILAEDRKGFGGNPQLQQNTEEKLDIVHIKLIKNNTFVAITDSKGNRKVGASSGCLEEMKGGPKLSDMLLKQLLNMWEELQEIWG
ncbi:putative ribosomal protein S11 mitochondrial [Bienertia sinuspersici]